MNSNEIQFRYPPRKDLYKRKMAIKFEKETVVPELERNEMHKYNGINKGDILQKVKQYWK